MGDKGTPAKVSGHVAHEKSKSHANVDDELELTPHARKLYVFTAVTTVSLALFVSFFVLPRRTESRNPVPMPFGMRVGEDGHQEFRRWLTDRGAEFPKVHLLESDDLVTPSGQERRGVFARRPIHANEVFTRIPFHMLMSEDHARDSKIYKKCVAWEASDFQYSYTVLSLFLMQEVKNQSSVWRPYLDLLPKTFPNLPFYWSKSELKELRGTSAEQRVADVKGGFRKEYDYIAYYVDDFKGKYSFDDFLWAQAVVSTRSFQFAKDGAPMLALVPFVDLINHKSPAESTYQFDDATQSFIMTSLVSREAGEEVFDFYGDKGNSRLLLHYGFTIEDNPEDEVSLEMDIPEFAVKTLKRSRFPFSLRYNFDHPQTRELLSVFRVFASGDAMKLQDPDFMNLPYIAVGNELAALQMLQSTVQRGLKRFKKPLKHDEAQLRKVSDNRLPDKDNLRNALRVRVSEHKILTFWNDSLSEAIRLLSLDDPLKEDEQLGAFLSFTKNDAKASQSGTESVKLRRKARRKSPNVEEKAAPSSGSPDEFWSDIGGGFTKYVEATLLPLVSAEDE